MARPRPITSGTEAAGTARAAEKERNRVERILTYIRETCVKEGKSNETKRANA